MSRRVLPILSRERWPVVGLTILLAGGLMLSFCLVGIPIVIHALGQLTVVLLRGARKAHGETFEPEPPAGWSGALTLAAVLVLLATAALTSSALMVMLGTSSALLRAPSFIVAGALVGAALAPFSLAPMVTAAGVKKLSDAVVRSLELTSTVGPLALARRGAALGALLTGTVALSSALSPLLASASIAQLAVWLLPACGCVVLSMSTLADAFVTLSTRRLPKSTPPRLPGRLHALARLAASFFVIPVSALAIAALTPTAMRPLEKPPFRRGLYEEKRELPSGGVHVRQRGDGIVIEALDGGGAGFVRTPFPMSQAAIFVEDGTLCGGPPESFAVLAVGHSRWACTVVDRDGVRLDDSLGDRVFGRLGPVGGSALTLGLVLLFVLAFRLAVSLGEARTLEAPDLGSGGGKSLKALEGTLRLGENALLRAERRSLIVEGEAFFEAEPLRARVPEGSVPTLGDVEHELTDGQPVVLVSRFSGAFSPNLREAGSPWPDDGLLIVGRRADAADALMKRASTSTVRIALSAFVAWLVATGRLLEPLWIALSS